MRTITFYTSVVVTDRRAAQGSATGVRPRDAVRLRNGTRAIPALRDRLLRQLCRHVKACYGPPRTPSFRPIYWKGPLNCDVDHMIELSDEKTKPPPTAARSAALDFEAALLPSMMGTTARAVRDGPFDGSQIVRGPLAGPHVEAAYTHTPLRRKIRRKRIPYL